MPQLDIGFLLFLCQLNRRKEYSFPSSRTNLFVLLKILGRKSGAYGNTLRLDKMTEPLLLA